MAILDLTTTAGALDIFSVSAVLNAGETIVGLSAGVGAWPYSPVADPNASQLLRGTPSYSGTTCSAWVGGVPSTNNFLADAVYTLAFWVTTSSGRVFPSLVNINVSPFTPPAATTGSTIPSGEYNESANFAPTVSATYYATAPCVCAIPSTNVGGDIVVVNNSTGNVTFSGTALNYATLPVLPPGSSLVLHWSTLNNGVVIL